ncbi:MAG: aspartate kinase, partial [Halobacteriales archaeon]
MRVVAKFGGTSLGTGDRITRAADSIAEVVEAGHEVAVVASAMGSTTDDLLAEIAFDVDETDRAEILSMGERTSIRLLKAALSSNGIAARFVEPGDDRWPVVLDEAGEVDAERTGERTNGLLDEMDRIVPVIAGFLAERPDGSITTLGRGGSDTTAVMLGRYLSADEVVIVTDVEGVMTGDPRVVDGARNVESITVDELRDLSFRGAEVVAPSALAHKHDDLDVRVVHYQHGDLLTGGTDVEGTFESLVDLREEPLACITVAGRAIRNRPGLLQELSRGLGESGINIDAVSSGLDSLTFYVDQDNAARAENVLHREIVDHEHLSSVTVDDDVAVVRITGGGFPDEPGVISEIVDPIATAGITIHDLITSATSIAIFVDWADR